MRRLLAWGLAGALAIVALRSHAGALAERGGAAPWSALAAGDRRVLANRAEAALGQDAATGGRSAGPAYRRLALADPLAAGPFVYAGALAARERRDEAARALFAMAVLRDPRARAPHYFLALDAMRRGDDDRAIAELAALNAVQSSASLAEALAAYLEQGGKLAAADRFLDSHPALREAVLNRLAHQPDRLPMVLALARKAPPATAGAADWRGTMLKSLVDAGRIAEASAHWPVLTGHPAPRDPAAMAFAPTGDPAPFDWVLSSDGGLASFQRGGALDLLFYGRDATVLATRDLLLAPGRYRLALSASGRGPAGTVRLRLRCVAPGAPLAEVAIAPGPVVAPFVIPAGCGAQRIELRGAPGESEREAEWHLSQLRVEALP